MKVQGSITSIFLKGVWAQDYYPIISPLLSAHSQHGHFIQPPELLKFFTQNTTPDQIIINLYSFYILLGFYITPSSAYKIIYICAPR